ncbi:MAG: hypothetical protein ACT4ON_04465 [Bacteroidota bacterium]
MNSNEYDYNVAERFSEELITYVGEYKTFLSDQYSKNTVGKKCGLIYFCIDHMLGYEKVMGFEDITIDKCGSKMLNSYNYHERNKISLTQSREILHSFFLFIYDKHGIANQKLLEGLKK